jgi:predicted nucleic acid-binding Zn ribbon protein
VTEPEPPEQPDVPEEPAGGEPETDAEHRADGLDLARSMVRGAAASGAAPAQPTRSRRSSRRRGRRRGDDTPLSGAHPDDRDPQTLSREVDRLVDDQGWGLDLRVRGVFARWPEIVGPEIGAHSTPETLVDGVLVVRTDSTAWATQLKLLTTSVVRRLNAELGDGTVTVVEVRGPHAPSWKHGRRGLRDGRGPRDTYG